MTKFFSVLICFLTLIGANAQTEFQRAFRDAIPVSRTNMSVALEDAQGNKSMLPIVILKGAEAGPTFTWLAGVHGSEYAPIIATQQLLEEIDPAQLKGTLVILPLLNDGAFYGREAYINPVDGVNLNNAFPGDANGSITQRIAHYVTENIVPVSDVFLDIHCGDAPEDLLPFVCYYVDENRPQQTGLAKRLSDGSGFEYSVAYPFNIDYKEPAKYAFKQAAQDGKTALSIESGRLGLVEKEAVDLVKTGVYNMLDIMGMYAEGSGPHPELKLLADQIYIDSTVQGIFYSDLKAGDQVLEGQEVGYTTDAFGRRLETYHAPKAGTVLYMLATPPINVEDTVMCISTKTLKN
ncbi:M14 family metallopeptidase [Gilvibacter sp.]|uniref:M14 family metallopeptidase n=1 Tax=Gilvibacter sp. TaxID=2729997 RepID=UPI003F4A0239